MMTDNLLEGWEDIKIPPAQSAQEWFFRVCKPCGPRDLSGWKFRSEEVVRCLEAYAAEKCGPIQAHNAMLRRSLELFNPLDLPISKGVWDLRLEALDATGPDVLSWQEAFAKKAVEAYLGAGAYADVCKQLATVTTQKDEALRVATEYQDLYKKAAGERDALVEDLEAIKEHADEENTRDIKHDPRMLLARLRTIWDMTTLALAFKPKKTLKDGEIKVFGIKEVKP